MGSTALNGALKLMWGYSLKWILHLLYLRHAFVSVLSCDLVFFLCCWSGVFCACACVSVFGGEILGSKRGNGTSNTLTVQYQVPLTRQDM